MGRVYEALKRAAQQNGAHEKKNGGEQKSHANGANGSAANGRGRSGRARIPLPAFRTLPRAGRGARISAH